jgi:hypothetical protein
VVLPCPCGAVRFFVSAVRIAVGGGISEPPNGATAHYASNVYDTQMSESASNSRELRALGGLLVILTQTKYGLE